MLAVSLQSLTLESFHGFLVYLAAKGLDLSKAGCVVERVEAISDGPDGGERGRESCRE